VQQQDRAGFESRPVTGTGIGLRTAHIAQLLSEQPDLPWLELLSDNVLAGGGLIPAQLSAVREHYPLTLHGVGMNLGSLDPLDWDYIRRIKDVAARLDVSWISEHICFTSHGGHHSHDLLPLPNTEEALQHLVQRIGEVQDFLGQRILMENASSYISYRHDTMSEAEFIGAMAEQADCHLLLDVNNAYVNQVNHGSDALDLLRQLPLERVREVHLAGYQDKQDYLLDAHNSPVSTPVWALYRELMALKPGIPTLIEWDNEIPALAVLIAEARRADSIAAEFSAAGTMA
jgi:uncharacterized protein (UPF0276 family)